ncbi:MAG: UDP-N-acetylmuramoyl-tripeptide--D-alanyl-D-alanine ligase [Chitinophagales bacterium]
MTIAALYDLYRQSSGVTTDTRSVPANAIFFALKGERFNGNTFAAAALQAGAAYAVIDEPQVVEPTLASRLILVGDVLKTLQELSAWHRQQLKCPVIAITGSNGKTTTKELLATVLSRKFKTVATKGNLNNHIGIPLTLLSIPLDTEMAIVEMGANHQQEIAGYCLYARPDFGLITNIGKAHLEGFGGEEGVFKGKTELFHFLANLHGKLFVFSGEPKLLSLAKQLFPNDHVLTYGAEQDDWVSAHGTVVNGMLVVEVNGLHVATQLVGGYNFPNVMAAWCVGKYFGVSEMDMQQAIEQYVPTNNRSQKVSWKSNTIILDAYNANPSSMAEALRNFTQLEGDNKMVVLGEMKELGAAAPEEHLRIARQAADMPLKYRVFLGSAFSFLENKPGFIWFAEKDQLKFWFRSQGFQQMQILIKGSRANGLEQLLVD